MGRDQGAASVLPLKSHRAKGCGVHLEFKHVRRDFPAFQQLYDQQVFALPNVQHLTSTLMMKRIVTDRVFQNAPIDAITPQVVAQYRDARTATRGNREIALLSHVFNIARELGHTKEQITKKIYRRIGEIVQPTK